MYAVRIDYIDWGFACTYNQREWVTTTTVIARSRPKEGGDVAIPRYRFPPYSALKQR